MSEASIVDSIPAPQEIRTRIAEVRRELKLLQALLKVSEKRAEMESQPIYKGIAIAS